MSLPSGTITLLFTDIERSTWLLQQIGDTVYANVLADHRRLLRAAFCQGDGRELETQGDGFLFGFRAARQAVLGAIEAQRAVLAHQWPGGISIRVRMGFHTGEPVVRSEGYVGIDLHRAARICAAGHGGQILLSETTRILVRDDLPPDVGLRDLGEHNLKDFAQPVRLFQVTAPGLPTEFPSLKSLANIPNNLPVQLTSFVGRDREMQDLVRLLSRTRLLTLTGAGGLGKTRLALQVAAQLADAFLDGVWLVELASLSDAELVPQVVATTLGLREQPGHPLLTTLGEYFQSKHLLLVLDNCEHLIESCAALVDALLRVCRRLHILTTSRQALGVAGETMWLVPPLPSPDPQRLPMLETLRQYDAVRLFEDRATTVLPDFVITPENVQAVAEVCHRLDGIPLAIELAAVRTKVLSVHQIAQRLEDRFRLLTGGDRTVLPRHQTLKAALEWSYGLLLEKERSLYQRLSVFAGGCTLEAAEMVCARSGIEREEIFDLVAQLVDKSLLIVDRRNSAVRFRTLETIRQFGREKLFESGEEVEAQRHHARFFLSLAESAEPQLHGREQAQWLETLETEHDNLRAALEWSLEDGDVVTGLRLSSSLWWFWSVRGYYREGRGWLEAALRKGGDASPALRAKALGGAGYLATIQLEYNAARAFLEESLAIRQQIDSRADIADSLYALGRVALRQEDFPRAAALYEEALALFEESGSKRDVARLLNSLGVLAASRGDLARARPFFEKSLVFQRELRNLRGVAFAAGNLGVIAFRRGDCAAARALLQESLTIDQQLGDKRGSISEVEELGLLAAAEGRAARAARLLGAAEALRETLGAPLSSSERSFYDYDRYVAAISAALGREAITTVWTEGRAMPLKEAVDYAIIEGE